MKIQDVVPKKKRGPKPTGKGVQVQVRLQPDLLAALDRLVGECEGITRPEALRSAFREWASERGYLPGAEGRRPEELNASNDD